MDFPSKTFKNLPKTTLIAGQRCGSACLALHKASNSTTIILELLGMEVSGPCLTFKWLLPTKEGLGQPVYTVHSFRPLSTTGMDRWASVAAPTGTAPSAPPNWPIMYRWQKPGRLPQPKTTPVTPREFNKWKTRRECAQVHLEHILIIFSHFYCRYLSIYLLSVLFVLVPWVPFYILQQPVCIFSAPSVSHYRLGETETFFVFLFFFFFFFCANKNII